MGSKIDETTFNKFSVPGSGSHPVDTNDNTDCNYITSVHFCVLLTWHSQTLVVISWFFSSSNRQKQQTKEWYLEGGEYTQKQDNSVGYRHILWSKFKQNIL